MTTSWEHLTITDATGLFNRRLLAHGYQMWQRIMDDEPVFILTRTNEKPSAGSGGYRYLDSAVKAKGIRI
jgi:hypothetical protein